MTRPSPTLIGVFVLGALGLVVAGVLFFGAATLRENRLVGVSFFDTSVAGLRVGAPVTFRGVPVGEVKSMGVRVNPRTGQSIIQVNMEIVPGMVTVYGTPLPGDESLVPSLVQNGLTAQLVKQSFVTGLLSVELAFRPGVEVSRVGDVTLPEIPTVPGDLEGLAKQLQSVDIAAALESLQRTLASVDAVLNTPELGQAVRELPKVTSSAARALSAIEREVASSGAELRETAASMRSLASTLERDTARTLAALRGTLENTDAALGDARAFVDPRGHTAIQVQRAIDDLAATAARLRNLAERVDRDPSVLVRGR
jgi:paraquat-inducible protein B